MTETTRLADETAPPLEGPPMFVHFRQLDE